MRKTAKRSLSARDWFYSTSFHAHTYQPGPPPAAAEYVIVTTPDLTAVSHPRATCDEFTRGTLTITSIDTQEPIATYAPGTWTRAEASDASGYHLFAFEVTK